MTEKGQGFVPNPAMLQGRWVCGPFWQIEWHPRMWRLGIGLSFPHSQAWMLSFQIGPVSVGVGRPYLVDIDTQTVNVTITATTTTGATTFTAPELFDQEKA